MIDTSKSEKENRESSDQQTAGSNELHPKVLIDTLVTFCSGTNLSKEDAEVLALESLLPAHHPLLGQLFIIIIIILKTVSLSLSLSERERENFLNACVFNKIVKIHKILFIYLYVASYDFIRFNNDVLLLFFQFLLVQTCGLKC